MWGSDSLPCYTIIHMEKKDNLEFKIIESLQGKLNETDLRHLVEWMEADPEHLLFFNQVKEKYEAAELSKMSAADLDGLFEKFKAQVPKKKKVYSLRMFYRVAASLAVLITAGWLSLKFGPEILNRSEEVTAEIEKPYIISSGKKYIIDHADSHISFAEVLEHQAKPLKNNERKKLAPEWNELVVPRGCRISIDLADGTQVLLNSESKLEYPLTFTEHNRTVRLSGEGYFVVTHRPEQPFIVETEYLDVTVLGTTFNVSAFEDDEQVITTLVEGSVKLHAEHLNQEVVLLPNENGILVKGQNEVRVMPVQADQATSWIMGYYSFSSENLDVVMQKLIRSYGIPIQLKDESLKEMTFSGKLDIKEKITDVLNIIKMVAPIEYEINNNQIIIQKTD